MPDLNNVSVSRGTAVTSTVASYTIAGQVLDSGDNHVIADFTGENAFQWPDCLNTLTPEQRDSIMNDLNVATQILLWKAGV